MRSQALALTRNCKATPPPPPSQSAVSSQPMSAAASTPSAAAGGCSSRDSAERGSSPVVVDRSGTPLDVPMVSSPSIKEEYEANAAASASASAKSSSSGKSLPVHCIVEAVCTLDESRAIHQSSWRRRSLIETDSFVIIPVSTPFHDLVQTALLRLGYSAESAAAAKGSVVIKNWKALNFDQITEDPLVSVGDILGELTTVATLKIQVFRGRPGSFMDAKDKLLRYLLVQSHGLLVSAGCPLDEIMLSQMCRGGASNIPPEMSEECKRKFDQWWAAQCNPQSPGRVHLGPPPSQFSNAAVHQHQHQHQPSKAHERPHLVDPGHHPAMQTVHNQFPTQKTRMRTSFDPELELPKLQRWFADNQHPSRQQIQQYVKELNSLESRRGRKPLDVNNVVYWFKNARAAQKRAEVRNVGPGMPCHLSSGNGYNNHSPTNGAGFLLADGYLNSERLEHRLKNNYRGRGPNMSDDFSNAGSDMEEDDMQDTQPASPVGPLSLTTNRKDETREDSPRTSTPLNEAHVESNIEPKEEPINYHSSSDHSNNNKVQISDVEDEDMDNEADNKNNFEIVSPMIRPISQQRICGSPDADNQMLFHRPGGESLERLAASFPIVPNSMFSHSIMYMSQYIPGLSHTATSPPGSSALAMSALSADERRKRNRTFIDPVTEVPRLEQWFSMNTHPSHNLILKYTEELNCMAYRQKFPRLEPKNVQFWFKNRRAKCKRLKMSLFDSQTSGHFHHGEKE